MLGISPSSNVSAIPRSGHCLRIASALTSVQKDSSSFGLTSSVSSSVQCTIQLSCSERDRFRLIGCDVFSSFCVSYSVMQGTASIFRLKGFQYSLIK